MSLLNRIRRRWVFLLCGLLGLVLLILYIDASASPDTIRRRVQENLRTTGTPWEAIDVLEVKETGEVLPGRWRVMAVWVDGGVRYQFEAANRYRDDCRYAGVLVRHQGLKDAWGEDLPLVEFNYAAGEYRDYRLMAASDQRARRLKPLADELWRAFFRAANRR